MEGDWVLKALERLIGRKPAEVLASAIVDSGYPIRSVIDYSFDRRKEVAFHAAWVMENLEHGNPGIYLPILPIFLEAYHRQKNPSCRRHYTRLMMAVTSPEQGNKYAGAIGVSDAEEVIGTKFDWLADPATPVAVSVNCLDILYNLSDKHAWISEELRHYIPRLLKDGSAAMQSRGRKVLRRIGD